MARQSWAAPARSPDCASRWARFMASVEFSRKFCISERMLEDGRALRQRPKKRSEFHPFYVSTRNRDAASDAPSHISDLFGGRRTNAFRAARESFRPPLPA